MTLAEWEARLEVLEKAFTSGTLIVKHGDTQLTYRSMDELSKAITYVKGKIDKLSDATGRRPRYVQQDTKGL